LFVCLGLLVALPPGCFHGPFFWPVGSDLLLGFGLSPFTNKARMSGRRVGGILGGHRALAP